MTFPSFFENPSAYNRVRIGGRLLLATLREIDGIKVEADWSEQKPTGKSGADWIFKGMKPTAKHKLTFECVNAAEEADLRALFERMQPQPSFTAPAAPTTPTTSATGVVDAFGSPPDPTTATANPGPRPPTLTVENAFLAYVKTTAVSLDTWEGPSPTPTNSIKFMVTFVPQKPPVPAGTGIAPSVTTVAPTGAGIASTGGGASAAATADQLAAWAGAGT